MTNPASKVAIVKSGTWEVAQGSDSWLEFEDQRQSVAPRSPSPAQIELPKLVFEQANCVSANYLSEVESAILNAKNPLVVTESEEISALGNRGVWTNRAEVAKFNGDLSLYQINEDPNPQVITKKVERNVEYIQELAVRFLKPPVPPTPGEILIKHDPSILPPPAPPLVIRQQPPRPTTPEPLIVREAPPVPPASIGRKIITISAKRLPPPPRKVVIERLAPIPTKPQSIITERWLPYAQTKRRVIYQAAPPDPVYCKPRNVIIQWEAPDVVVRQEVKYLGVVNANPVEYVRRYGEQLRVASELPSLVRSIPAPDGLVLAANYSYNPVHELEGDVEALRLIDLDSEGLSMYRSQVALSRSRGFSQLSGSSQLRQSLLLGANASFAADAELLA